MPSYLYRPGHPHADAKGFVEKNAFYTHKYMSEPDMRMFDGNKPVQIRFNSDTMPETRHMCNGKYYTSKKKFRNETKAYGCIEVGNETKAASKPKEYVQPTSRRQRRDDIKKAIYELRNQ